MINRAPCPCRPASSHSAFYFQLLTFDSRLSSCLISFQHLLEDNFVLSRFFTKLLAVLCLTTLLTLAARAQDKWTWPDKPKNLQVFPKDWSGTRLRPVMVGFTR